MSRARWAGQRHWRGRQRLVSLLLAFLLLATACGPSTGAPDDLPATATPAAAATAAPATAAPVGRAPTTPAATTVPGAAPTTPVRAATPPPRQTPAPRGDQTLTLAGGIEAPRTFDPALVRDVATSFLARQVYSGLLKLDERLEPAPDLAVALPAVSPDRLTYTFTLREGALFHDGTPVTAETVKQALERATDPRLAGGDGRTLPAATYLIDIKGAAERLRGERPDLAGVRVTGPRTLEITLAAPQATFLVKLTHTTAAVVDVRQTSGRQWWKRPNGSGPFRLSEWRDGDRLVLTRWERYYDGPPALERVVWLLGASASQPLNLYEGGKIDLTEIGTDSIDRALVPGSALNRELRITPQLSLTYVAFNVSQPPFDDPKVRQALVRVIDREKMARVMFEGKVQAAYGLVPPALAGSLPATPPPRDQAAEVAAARKLLSESRYGAALPRPRLYVTGGGVAGMLRDVYQRDLGLTIDVIAVPWNDFLQGLEAREFESYLLSWLADYPDPQSFVETLFRGDSPENHTTYANPRVDAVLDEAARTTDATRRAALYREAQQLILDDAVVLPLYFATEYTLVKPHVKGLTITPMGILGLERVWIER